MSKLEQKRSISICEFNFPIWQKWKKLKQRRNPLIIYRFKSIIWDELRVEIGEIPKVIYHVWDEIRIEANKT